MPPIEWSQSEHHCSEGIRPCTECGLCEECGHDMSCLEGERERHEQDREPDYDAPDDAERREQHIREWVEWKL